MANLPSGFPFGDVVGAFIREFRRCRTYWYVPKTRALNETNIETIRTMTRLIGDEFADSAWNTETQDAILERSQGLNILDPYKEGNLQDRTALIRIWRAMLELLGLVWVRDGKQPVMTEAGARILAEGSRAALEGQIAKYQYPNPGQRAPDARLFKGLAPHLFLLQVMRNVGYLVSVQEYNLFVNLAKGHEDLERVVRYILTWRNLHQDEREQVLDILNSTPSGKKRARQTAQDSSYQRAFFAFASYIDSQQEEGQTYLVATNRAQIDAIVEESAANLKLRKFENKADWFAYYGNPDEQPSWFTYVRQAVESAPNIKAARAVARANRRQLSASQIEEVERLEIEKGIEDFYASRVSMLEPGLRLVPNGRQYSTPIGPIDLLCQASNGDYVVVEIKAAEAKDAVFGQILRYIGWVHRDRGQAPVRGIILASGFPEAARYSRIGLLKPDAEHFIQFKQHGLNAATA